MLKFSSVEFFVCRLVLDTISPSNAQHSIGFHCFAQQACSMPGLEGCKSQATLGLHFSPVRRESSHRAGFVIARHSRQKGRDDASGAQRFWRAQSTQFKSALWHKQRK